MTPPETTPPDLPAELVRNVVGVHGEEGRDWLAGLSNLIDECARRWSLALGTPAGQLSFNYLVDARLPDGTPAVLKLGVPHRELSTEAAALRTFDGRGAVQLIDSDDTRGVLLLERVEPGEPLWDLPDEVTAPIAASVMRKLWRPPPDRHPFPTLADWMRGFDRLRARFDGATGPLPARMVDRAGRLFSELGATDRPVLLHGDLHHGNILSARRSSWLAIDPKGVVGAPGFEVGAYMRNPIEAIMSDPDPVRRLARRVAMLSEHLGLPRSLIRDWAFIQAMLSAWWSVEDGGPDWETTVAYAKRIAVL